MYSFEDNNSWKNSFHCVKSCLTESYTLVLKKLLTFRAHFKYLSIALASCTDNVLKNLILNPLFVSSIWFIFVVKKFTSRSRVVNKCSIQCHREIRSLRGWKNGWPIIFSFLIFKTAHYYFLQKDNTYKKHNGLSLYFDVSL